MRQRRGMNFMGNSYMGWRKKGKGFFIGEGLRDEGIRGVMKGAGNRWKVELSGE